MRHRKKRRFEIAVGLVLALIVTSCCEGTAMETIHAYAANAENWSVVYSDDLQGLRSRRTCSYRNERRCGMFL